MNIQPGDHVRFLNEALEGIVVKLHPKERVEVEDDHGFGHIVHVSKIVKVQFDHLQNQEKIIFEPDKKKLQPQEEITPVKKLKKKIYAAQKNKIQIYVQLTDRSSPLSSPVEMHLVNNTDFTVLYSFSKHFELRDQGLIAGVASAHEIISLFSFSQDENENFDSFRIQLIVHSEKEFLSRPALNKHFTVDVQRWTADDEWQTDESGKNYFYPVDLIDFNEKAEIDVSKLVKKFSEEEEKVESKAKISRGKNKKSGQAIIHVADKVVDLHIESLIKDFSGMSNAQIISYQLNYFLYKLDQALMNNLRKITFIHGVGTGVLKIAIREELKHYPNIRYSDAPEEKFGYGATEIYL